MDLKIQILKSKEDNLMVSFPYNPQFVEKIKTIKVWIYDTVVYHSQNGQKATLSFMNKLDEIAQVRKEQ